MAHYEYLRQFRRNKQSDAARYLNRIRTWEYRQNVAIHRAERPTQLDKARMLGYKSKQGVCIFRVRVKRGGRAKKIEKGNNHGKPSKGGVYQMKCVKSLQTFGEMRVGRKHGNLRVLASYWVGQDRIYKFYEVIMIDPCHDSIKNDRDLNWICANNKKHREARGLTNGTRTSRGLGKGIRYNKTKGGSRHACWRNNNRFTLRRYR